MANGHYVIKYEFLLKADTAPFSLTPTAPADRVGGGGETAAGVGVPLRRRRRAAAAAAEPPWKRT